MFRNTLLTTAILAGLATPSPLSAAAPAGDWPTNPTDNTPIHSLSESATLGGAVTDGAGGAIIVWSDDRSGNSNVFAQRIDALGLPRWTTDGIAITSSTATSFPETIIPDGAGGAIILWTTLDNDIDANFYAQRINANGNQVWPTHAPICTATGKQEGLHAVSNGQGGAFITWQDFRDQTDDPSIYVARLNADAQRPWTANGVRLGPAIDDEDENAQVCPNGLGGAIVVWHGRNLPGFDTTIFAQNVDSSGTPQWAANGVNIAGITGGNHPAIISDRANGAYVCWHRALRQYCQRVSPTGSRLWHPDGVALGSEAGQFFPQLAPAPGGGLLVGYYQGLVEGDVYCQIFSSSGTPLAPDTAIAVCTAPGDQTNLVITPDPSGGAIFTWDDHRANPLSSNVYAARVFPSGNQPWGTNGVQVNSTSSYAPAIVGDGAGGAIITWNDVRTNINTNIYAAHLTLTGTHGNPDGAIHHLAAGATGSIPGGSSGIQIHINTNTDPDGAYLNLQRHETAPTGTISPTPATAPNNEVITPTMFVGDVHWSVSGLGTSGLNYNISLNVADETGPVPPGQIVIMKRSHEEAPWIPQPTTESGNNLTVSGLNSFSDFALGTIEAPSSAADWTLYP